MKVLMTTDTLGGVWAYTLELAGALADRGVEICLATMGRPLVRHQRLAAGEIEGLELSESWFKLEWMEDSWGDVASAGEWLLDLADKTKPDLLHLNQFSFASLPWKQPKVVMAHTDICSWYYWVKGRAPEERWARYRREVAAGLAAADLVVVPTRATLGDLAREYGEQSQVKVIPIGVHPEQKRATSAKEGFVLSVGRLWDEAKNIKALSAISGDIEAPIVAVGERMGPSGELFEFTGLNLPGIMEPSRLSRLYRSASVYALPARYEPLGLSVLEAAREGCALVLGDIPSLRENWEGAALFVEPDSHASLRDRINQLLADETLREKLGAAAEKRSQEFTADRMAEAYLREYQQLTGIKVPSRRGAA